MIPPLLFSELPFSFNSKLHYSSRILSGLAFTTQQLYVKDFRIQQYFLQLSTHTCRSNFSVNSLADTFQFARLQAIDDGSHTETTQPVNL